MTSLIQFRVAQILVGLIGLLVLAAFISIWLTLGAYWLIHAPTAPGPIFSAVMGAVFIILASMMINPGAHLIGQIKHWRKPRTARLYLLKREFERLCSEPATALQE